MSATGAATFFLTLHLPKIKPYKTALTWIRATISPYFLAANIARRHLTNEQKRATITALLKANPEKSSRSLAKVAGTHHDIVGEVRKELEAGGGIRHQPKRVGSDGVVQAVAKTKKSAAPPAPVRRSLSDANAEKAMELNGWFNRAAESVKALGTAKAGGN